MTKRIRASLLTALAIAGVSASAASAAPVTIHIRIEGATQTIYDGPVTTDEHMVSTATDGNTPRLCNGTKVGSPAGPTGTTALDDAAKQNGFTWDAVWDTTSDGDYYPYLTIGPDTINPADHYWASFHNWKYTSYGGCGERVYQGDDFVWAYADFSVASLLRLTGPTAATTGQPFTVHVVDGQTNTAQAGATVGGATTNAAGNASVTYNTTGIYRLKAEKSGMIRSNALVVCVDPPGADPCTSSDKTAPTIAAALPGRRLASETGHSRTVLISWQASDGDGAGVAYYVVEVRELSDGIRTAKAGPWRTLNDRTTLTGVHFRGDPGSAYEFRVTAVDRAANRTQIVTDPLVLPVDDRDYGAWKLRGWKRTRSRSAWGLTVVRARKAGATGALRFRGGSVSLIGRKLARGGRLQVTLDGKSRTLRLRGRSGPRTVLWTSPTLKSGSHLLRLRTLGGGPVELDAVAPRP